MSNSCDCSEDGFCERYQREMRGRWREICRGINVDLGTAAAFREQWRGEARPSEEPARVPRKPLILRTNQAAGDAVVMTVAIYSLHRAYPKKYVTAVDSPWPEVFHNNPKVVPLEYAHGAPVVHMHYPAIHQSNERGIHFMQGWCEHLGAALGISVPLLINRPCLYFATANPPLEDYWVICSGGKSDFTNKLWGHYNYQEVVDRLHGKVRFIQVGAAQDNHPPLYGVENMVGRTTLRGLFNLVRRSRGVLCGVSLLMHVAAALEKPAVVIAGGREPVQWNAYPKQQYVHTIGALPCSDMRGKVGGACWRMRVEPTGDGTVFDKDPCQRPIQCRSFGQEPHVLPECMTLIDPAWVAELIKRYNCKQ